MPTVTIPQPYRGVTQGRSQIQVSGTTVRECLEAVERECPGFRELIFTPEGEPHRFTKLFCNGEPPADGLDSRVADADEIEVLSPIAGG